MKNNKIKRWLLIPTSICTFAIIAGTVTVITQFSKQTSENSNDISNKEIASFLGTLIKNPIQINTTLTANEALLANNEQSIINKIKLAIINQLGNTVNINNHIYLTQTLLNNLNIALPKTVSYTNYLNGEMSNVNLTYDEISIKPNNANSYSVIGFNTPNKNANANQNQVEDVANKLALIINNPIELIKYNYTVQQSLSSSSNEQILINAIRNAIEVNLIENDINNQNIEQYELNVNNITYSMSEIMQNLTVNLNHDFVIDEAYNEGYLDGISLVFNGLNNAKSQIKTETYNTYKVINFLKPDQTDIETNNENISNNLSNSVLTNGTINLPSTWDLTAAQSLQTNNIANLKSYVTTWLSNALTTYVNKQTNNEINSQKYFVINHVGYSVSYIISEINLIFPNSAQAGIISNQELDITITFSNQNIELTNTQFNKIFKITGFKQATNLNAWPSSQEAATILDKAILNPINLNNPNVFDTNNEYLYDVAQSISIQTQSFNSRIIAVIEYDISLFAKNNSQYASNSVPNSLNINAYAVTYSELASWITPSYVSALIGINSNVNNSMQYNNLTLSVTSPNENSQSVQLNNNNLTNYVVIGFSEPVNLNDDNNASNIVELLTKALSNIFNPNITLSDWSWTVAQTFSATSHLMFLQYSIRNILINELNDAVTTSYWDENGTIKNAMYSINYETKGTVVINGLQYEANDIVNNFLLLQNAQTSASEPVNLTTQEPILFSLNNEAKFYNLIIKFNFGNTSEEIKPNYATNPDNLTGYTISGFKELTISEINAFNYDLANELLQYIPNSIALQNYNYTVGKSFTAEFNLGDNYPPNYNFSLINDLKQNLDNDLINLLNKDSSIHNEYFNSSMIIVNNNAFPVPTIVNSIQFAWTAGNTSPIPVSLNTSGTLTSTYGILMGVNLSSNNSSSITVAISSNQDYTNPDYEWTKANKLFGLTGFVKATNIEINEQISKYAATQYSTVQEGNGWPTNTNANTASPMYINLTTNSTIINALNEAKTNLNNNLLINGIRNYFENQVLFGNADVQVIINTSSGFIAYPNFSFPLTTFLDSIQLGQLPEISDSMNNETQINIPLMISWENATPLPLYAATNNGWSSDWTTNEYTIQGFQTGTNNS